MSARSRQGFRNRLRLRAVGRSSESIRHHLPVSPPPSFRRMMLMVLPLLPPARSSRTSCLRLLYSPYPSFPIPPRRRDFRPNNTSKGASMKTQPQQLWRPLVLP
ncbi:hypothetical protein CF335_g9291 [Tilletia laevis]|nr:hypothetical protein CF335_g9291 [Tilletia laevis]